MRAKNTGILPHELARKISPWIVNSAEITGAVGKTALTGFAAFFLFGPLAGVNADLNGFLFLLGPWVCPIAMALLWTARLAILPFRIYRGSPFVEHGFADTGDDPAVMRLAALCNSDEARRHLWYETLKLSIILFAILGTAAILLRDSLNWILPSPQNQFLLNRKAGEPGIWFWLGLLGCSWLTFMILVSDHTRWCLITWAKREPACHVGDKQ